MTDLTASDPWGGLLPAQAGSCRLAPVPPEPLALLAPYPGRQAAMEAELGFGLPGPGASWSEPGRRCMWFGRGAALLIGAVPAGSAHGQVEDLSDGWAGARLSGASALDVLARLVPVDLRAAGEGAALRTVLGHMQVAILRREEGFDLYVMRSMAASFAREIADAMARVAARDALR